MADIAASSWAEVDNNNNSAAPLGWASGTMLPSSVEPTARAVMGAVKRFHNQISPVYTTTGSANAQVLTHSVAKAALVAGDLFTFIAGFTNTGAVTLNVDGLGAKAIQNGTVALQGSELLLGTSCSVFYDGTQFQLMGGQLLLGGTWTPSLLFGGAATGMTYSSQSGIYRRSGKLVYLAFDFTLSAKGSSTGQASISGIPYTTATGLAQPARIGLYASTSGVPAGGFDASYIDSAGAFITLANAAATGVTTYTDTTFTNTTRMSGSATYLSA